MCIILWFFIHVSHRSNKCVAVVIAAALYDPLPSIFPSDHHLIQTVVVVCRAAGSPIFVRHCARVSVFPSDLLFVCWLVGCLLACLLTEVLLLSLFCIVLVQVSP